jgi:3-hydroxyacyl-CoA dehydrogenase/enoyl-CoA hydratase/3-hydroxybutyryl-CoA epimerase
MPDDFRHVRLERDNHGIATVTIDVQGSPVNVFNAEVVGDLQRAVERLEHDPPRALVFRSGKPTGFFAGADVKEIRKLRSEDEARAVQHAGQQFFDRIDHLPFPTVAVVHGLCLGGGLEFALACDFRVARDDTQTKIGLPETQLGIIPGWGGTYRLPHLVGLRQALRIILEGSTLSAAKAAKAGLVDLAAKPETFEAEVQRFVEERAAGVSVRRPGRGFIGGLLDGIGRRIVTAVARKKLGRKGHDYPALPAALRAVEIGLRDGHDAGLAAERVEFPKLLFGPVARNLIELFLRREQARRPATWVSEEHAPRKVQKAAVVGAGVMGAGITQLLAINGVAVVLKDIDAEIAESGRKKVEKLTNDAAAKGVLAPDEAAAVLGRVTATAAWEPLADADLVIEAVVEREDVKRDVFRELSARLGPDAVFASNTSALSITRLAEAASNPGRVAGLHFFNPVHRMHLVEVVRGKATDDGTVATLVELVRKLGKVPVVVADSPGFLVNRILFPYLDEGVRLAIETGRGQWVDEEAERFGMPMGPLELLDEVGIDVAAHVAGSLTGLTTDPSPTPERLAEMVKDGALGKKAGRGFYTHEKGRGQPTRWAWDGRSPEPATKHAPGELSAIQKRLIYPMINEAAKCLEERVVTEAWVVDLAMVLGTGFAPFRGGPLHTADALGLDRVVREMEELSRTAGPRFEPAPLLRSLATEGRGFQTDRMSRTSKTAHEEVRR